MAIVCRVTRLNWQLATLATPLAQRGDGGGGEAAAAVTSSRGKAIKTNVFARFAACCQLIANDPKMT